MGGAASSREEKTGRPKTKSGQEDQPKGALKPSFKRESLGTSCDKRRPVSRVPEEFTWRKNGPPFNFIAIQERNCDPPRKEPRKKGSSRPSPYQTRKEEEDLRIISTKGFLIVQGEDSLSRRREGKESGQNPTPA